MKINPFERFMLRIAFLLLGWVVLVGCQQHVSNQESTGNPPRTARTQIERGPVRVTVEVTPEPARLSDEPQLTVTIDHEPGVEVRKPQFGSSVGAFLIRDFREPLPQTDGKRQIVRQIYKLEPTEAGPLPIDPFVVTFVDKRPNGDGKEHRIETESLTVNVVSSLDQQPSLAQLKGPQDPVPIPAPAASLWWWIAGGILVAILGLATWHYHRKQIASEPPPTPRELAERELRKLWESNTARAEVKQFYVELTGIVRRYIERTTEIHAPEQTTEEFLREIAHTASFTREERQRLKDFLESADLVKFAAHQPVFPDIEESFQRARRFVGLEAVSGAAIGTVSGMALATGNKPA